LHTALGAGGRHARVFPPRSSRRCPQTRSLRRRGERSPAPLAAAETLGCSAEGAREARRDDANDGTASILDQEGDLVLSRAMLVPRYVCAALSVSIVTLAVISFLIPSSAAAYATLGPAPVPGSPGLPDGRIYELVSPANKPGTQAAPDSQGHSTDIWATADGSSVAFYSTGPIGDAPAGVEEWTVARRSAGSWQSYGALPLPLGAFKEVQESETYSIGFSTDFTKALFSTNSQFVPAQPGGLKSHLTGIGDIHDLATGATVWLGEPLVSNPPGFFPGYENEYAFITGVSPDLSTVYFSDQGGYYEWHEGQVSPAGVLPNGSLDPYGAVPAGFNPVAGGSAKQNVEDTQNEVSEDGSRAFFVSPSPRSCDHGNDCAVDPPELYVRATAADGTQSTVLVSRDTLLPAVGGQPAAAPHGPLVFNDPNGYQASEGSSYVWATPDGSRAFFLSTDQLTAEAPADDSGKLYEFNLNTETLAYLAGATPPATEPGYPEGAEVLGSSLGGSRLLFAKFASDHEGDDEHKLTELDLWTDGPEGPRDGHVTPIAPLDSEQVDKAFPFTRAASDGSSFVFETDEAFPGFHFNNGTGHFDQIYRYEVATNSLTCLSCAPAGVTPSGNAQLAPSAEEEVSYNRDRGISENGDRVFFDTPEPLVPWDTNTKPPEVVNQELISLGYDVYEWENGKLFLISTGKSSGDSFVGDNSANGNSVFFATAEGLAPADTDGGYDVYDARIPEPGERTASAVPCEGEVCQGPPSVPSLLGAPASATFSGLGNPTVPIGAPATTSIAKSNPKGEVKKCKKGYVKKKTKCVKRPKAKQAAKGKKS
jgi:hypothetical protein